MIRIIHISDFHLENENPIYEKKQIVNALSKDLKTFVDDKSLFFFTGDLVDKGGIKFKNSDLAFDKFEEIFINEIFKENPTLIGKTFIVPGNHEVVRTKIDEITEVGLQTTLKDSTGLTNFLIKNRNSSNHLDRLEDYKKWEKQFYKKHNNFDNTNFENTFKISVDGLNVGISCFNSSWLCKNDSDKENLLIGKNQITNSLESIESCEIKFALIHHPIEFLKDFDRDECKNLLYKHYDILFTGHIHELSSTYTSDLAGNIFISIANSSIADNPKERKYVNGYSIIDLYPNDKIIVKYRKFVEQHSTFVPNTDIGTEDGTKTFQLLKEENLKIYEKNYQIISSLESRILDKLNDHIIMSNNYTDVNCSIDNLFVEPTILNNPQNSLEEKDTIKYTIESILSDEEKSNYLIFGLKESGKTILLDKMFIESTKRFNHFKKIPILMNFSNLDKDIIKFIREFLGVSSQEIDAFLKSNDIILFVDEIRFNAQNIARIESLKEFSKKYPKIQIISTTTQILENVIPEDYLNFNDEFKFNICFIQNFNSKEIKQLVTKWFVGKNEDLRDNMQKLIKSFTDFGLPKNPLSVTLFLWIFEKQEKKPINNSVLVELFVENLLEKTKIENIYSETFDFKNKQRLLSCISKFMHDNGNANLSYSIDFVELLAFIKEYLSTRFSGQPQKVLEDFIARGIFTYEDDNLVRFKSTFFFHYFLALYFDIDDDFKIYVFSDDNYLNYQEEIIYYTGLKRDDENILKFILDKLNFAFSNYNEHITKNYTEIDKTLEPSNVKSLLSFQIDKTKIENKISEKQMDDVYDNTLTNIPVQSNIENKNHKLETSNNIDTVLKLSSIILKNSEDVDDFELKKEVYSTIITSSISFLMLYRDSLLLYFDKNKKQPDNFPKNINFNLFMKFLPLIHQVVVYEWLGSQKLRPVILDKIKKDNLTLNISELEKFMSIFIYSDIKGSDYPEIIKKFIKQTKFKYLKDISFFKILSYYQLRINDESLDREWLKMLAEIKSDLGQLVNKSKGEFIKKIESSKSKNKGYS